MVSSILELVDELAVLIIEQIDDTQALRNLARTCSRLQTLAEPAIYHSILLKSRQNTLSLTRSIVNRPQRLDAVRRVEARPRYATRDFAVDELVNLIHRAQNLQHLVLESPFCNRIQQEARHGWAESMAALLRPICGFTIPRLTSLTLHLSSENRRYWSIDHSNAMIFAHPTLRSLKMSCATIGDDLVSSLEDRPRTPLKHLAFIECNISPGALRAVLSLPAALERLSLRENCDHRHSRSSTPNDVTRFSSLFTSDPVAFMMSLRQQKDSLERFAYASVQDSAPRRLAFRLPAFDPRDSTGLAGFHNLHDVSIEGCTLEFIALLETPHLAPPSLQRLSLTELQLPRLLRAGTASAGDQNTQLASFVPVCRTIPSVQYVELVSGRMTRDEAKDLLEASRDRLKGRDVIVRMYQRGSAGAIPPFLFGETGYPEVHVATLESGELLFESDGIARREALCVECS